MTTTYLELREKILRLLGDPEGAGYDNALILDAVRVAQEAILPWIPKLATTTLTGTGTDKIFALPSDLYTIDAVIVTSSGETIPQAILSPGKTWGENSSGTNNWLEYPSGSITLAKELVSGETYDIFYLAYWTNPTDLTADTFVMEVPAYAIYGLTLYSAAYMMIPNAANAAEMRQWLTKVDSGSPEHNPMMKASNWLISLFQSEMSRHPKHQKVQR